MRKHLLKIASILLIVALLLSLSACIDLSSIDWQDLLSYEVDNSYFSSITYTPKTYSNKTDNNWTYNYVFEISSSCSVDLYKFTAYVEIYSKSDALLDSQTIEVTQNIVANETFTFTVQVTSATQANATSIQVTFVGKSNNAFFSDKQQVTVTFVYNNGLPNYTVTITKGQTVTPPSNPKKDNYYFVGWYTNSYFANQYDFSRAVNYNLTLYAKYELDTLSIGDQIYSDTLKSVVTIYNTSYRTILGFPISSTTSQGSGFCFKVDDGCYYILTNCHVALMESGYTKQIFTIVDYQGNEYEGYLYSNPSTQVAAISAQYDLACVYFEATSTPVKALDIATSNPSLGTNVISIGTPNGEVNTVTYGKITEYRKVTLTNTPTELSNVTFNVITHNADIDNGSSGGPLIDTNLRVVGVNYAGVDNSTTSYAIPAVKVQEFLQKYFYTQNQKANETVSLFCCNYLVGSIFARNLPV